MAFGYCMWAINDFVFVWLFFFFLAHLSGKHNALFTSGLSSMFDGVALTLSEIKFIRPV